MSYKSKRLQTTANSTKGAFVEQYIIRSKYASVVAIDQHARSVTLAGIDLSSGEEKSGRLINCPSAPDIATWALSWAAPPVRFVYESGPCGFQLARDIQRLGHDCDVIAVTSIPRSAKVKAYKDDRKDAESLLDAVLASKSGCRAVFIPSEECEATRDLVRAYYDMMAALKRVKMQFSGMLLRHGIVWNERTPAGNLRATWTRQYISWARSIALDKPAENETLKYYLESVLSGMDRCNEMRKSCLECAAKPRFKPYVDALTRLKGVDDMTALTYVVTIDDFSRFKNGRSVSSYFGFTPSRHDSGEKVGRNGRITKAGDTTVRRTVIEGLASLPSFTGATKWARRGHEVSAAIEAEAHKCNARNRKRYQDLIKAGKKTNVAKVAVAKEVVREMWVLGRMVDGELANR